MASLRGRTLERGNDDDSSMFGTLMLMSVVFLMFSLIW
jgi:hypothetical protein